MLLTAALMLGLFNPVAHSAAHARVTTRHVQVGAWSVAVSRDRFADRATCAIKGSDVSIHRGVAIFRLGHGQDTTHAVYRLDGGPPHKVSEDFDAVEARGFFPERGWIVDPNGGEVAMPAAHLSGVRAVLLRASPRQAPRRIRVTNLDEAIASARSYGCVDIAAD